MQGYIKLDVITQPVAPFFFNPLVLLIPSMVNKDKKVFQKQQLSYFMLATIIRHNRSVKFWTSIHANVVCMVFLWELYLVSEEFRVAFFDHLSKTKNTTKV